MPQPHDACFWCALLLSSRVKVSQQSDRPATGRTHRAWVCYCRLWGRRVGWAIVTRLMFVYYTGARIRLPIVSWERRFIDMGQSNDAGSGNQSAGQPEGDDSEPGGNMSHTDDIGSGEDVEKEGEVVNMTSEDLGSRRLFQLPGPQRRRLGNRHYGMMLMSSTHHRFAGLFTIRRPGARPVTQLLVRGSPAQWGQKCSALLFPHLWLWAACRLVVSSRTRFKCSSQRGRPRSWHLLLARPACRLGRGDDGPLAHVLDRRHGVSLLHSRSVYACPPQVLKMPSESSCTTCRSFPRHSPRRRVWWAAGFWSAPIFLGRVA